MSKYIDAEKLKAEVKNLNLATKTYEEQVAFNNALAMVVKIIDSLQQEQPEVDLVTKLKHHLATTPKEQLEKEWKELEPWNNIGPTVQEFLYGKQPEVDLEKVYDAYCKVCGHYHHNTPAYICRHACDYFEDFEALLNTRKEE